MAPETSDLQSIPAILDSAWRAFTDLRTTLILVMTAAAALLLRLFAPELSDLLLRILLPLLAFSLALRLATHIGQAAAFRQGSAAPVPAVAPATVDLIGPPEAARLNAEDAVRAAYDVALVSQTGGVYGARRRAGIVGPILAAAGPLVLLAGLLVNGLFGWSAPEVIITRGGTGLPDGIRLALGNGDASAITVERPGASPTSVRVASGLPAVAGSLWLFEQGRGAALEAQAGDAAGRPVTLAALETGAGPQTTGPQTELSLAFPPTQTEQAFSAPEQGVVFRAVSYASLPERGIDRPVFLVEAYRDGEVAPALSELVEDEATLALDGVSYTLRRGGYLSALAAEWPGWPLVVLGGLLTAVGLAVAVLGGPQEAWVDVRARGRNAAAAVRTTGGINPGRDAAALAQALEGRGNA